MPRSPSLLLSLCLALLGASTASAASVSVEMQGDAYRVVGDDGPSALDVHGSIVFTGMEFEETAGGTVIAGAGCQQQSASVVLCPPPDAGTTLTADLGGGNDRMKYIADPPSTITAGPGDDEIETGYGRDVVRGGPGDDVLSGGRGDDELFGEDGDDRLDGWDGNDLLDGGAGADAVTGDGATVYAGGDDRILVRDGTADTVTCGDGADVVQADGLDVIAGGCEAVDRAVPGTGPDRPGAPPASGGGARLLRASARPLRAGIALSLRVSAPTTVTVAVRRGARSLGRVRFRVPRAGGWSRSIRSVGGRRLRRGTYRLRVSTGASSRTLTARVR
ncbi:calcium-binding protein [Patulibacter brassicae]|uniref:Calcium-binding protein n=1 Tax=Patulibacter brassicae TaxID=1705717 RepID=A0ABU4VL75_9ACTN|nr:calcium-binding protein [Patulibacter brassicae]MDX8152429.1 calcium-binding protein [Patulibacter brassicae]